jgi:transposase
VRVEAVPWAAHDSWFTRAFEELVAYHAQVMDKTAVTKLLGVSWEAIGNIIERVVARRLDDKRLHGVTRIGVDEFSYRKRHRYVTIVVDHDTKRVIWASKGRGAETLCEFCDALGEEGVAALKLVTLDMAGGYLKALRERAPHVELVFDRLHVAQLASRAVDEIRRALWRQHQGTDAGKTIKGSRYALLKSPWNLSRRDKERLAAGGRDRPPADSIVDGRAPHRSGRADFPHPAPQATASLLDGIPSGLQLVVAGDSACTTRRSAPRACVGSVIAG